MRAFSVAYNWLLSRPFYSSLDVTNYCNLRCQGCDFPLLSAQGVLGRKDIPLQTLEARINQLHHAFGSTVQVLAGFEPTMRKDLHAIIAASSQRNIVGLVTNGILVTEEKARQYWAAGLAFASISLSTLSEDRFKELAGTQRYSISAVKTAIELFRSTIPSKKGLFPKTVVIATTIDDKTSPGDMQELAEYAHRSGVKISFQPYSPTKPASVLQTYRSQEDSRVIRIETLKSVFQGSIASAISCLKKEYPYTIIGRKKALKNFDLFVREGSIPFKPRSLKVYVNGDIALYPEAAVFSNADSRDSKGIWNDYRQHVETLRQTKGFRAPNAYRCVNLTNPSTPVGDILGAMVRSVRSLKD